MAKARWGFDVGGMDGDVRPQDDFYRYAGGGWLAKNRIPPEESRWGTFMQLRRAVDVQLHAIVRELLGKRAKPGSPEQMLGDFFKSGMDEKQRSRLGARPLAPLVKRVRDIRDTRGLLDTIAYLHRIGVGVAWGAAVDQDAKDSERYALYVVQDGLGMPDRDYYLKTDAESTRVREAYREHVPALLRLAGWMATDAARDAESILKFETRLARHSMDKVTCRDVDKTYHKMSVARLAKLAPQIDWGRYLAHIGATQAGDVIVSQPAFIQAVARMMVDVPLPQWRTYLEWHVINDCASLLSPAFVKQSFTFYGRVMSGATKMRPLWRRVLGVVNGSLGELLGELYVARHFSPEAKAQMNDLVRDLFDAYEARIRALDWMSPATKTKAIKKLRAMTHKIGYPDRWKSYRGLVMRHDDYFGNALRSTEYEHRREVRKLGRKLDRGEWFMYPQTVNAYFAPSLNDIVFPAAILQPPVFAPMADAAVNYGAIGSVIGHEMTHGFDDQGAKYDAHGNVRPWWSPADKKRFEAKTRVLVTQYNAYTVADGVHVNGKLTLGENVADLGGAAIALDAYHRHLEKHPEKDVTIDGFTPVQRFFLGFSLFERELVRPEHQKMAAINDPHSPGVYRINGPVSNLVEFYEAFNVKKGDKLYREPKMRAKVW